MQLEAEEGSKACDGVTEGWSQANHRSLGACRLHSISPSGLRRLLRRTLSAGQHSGGAGGGDASSEKTSTASSGLPSSNPSIAAALAKAAAQSGVPVSPLRSRRRRVGHITIAQGMMCRASRCCFVNIFKKLPKPHAKLPFSPSLWCISARLKGGGCSAPAKMFRKIF